MDRRHRPSWTSGGDSSVHRYLLIAPASEGGSTRPRVHACNLIRKFFHTWRTTTAVPRTLYVSLERIHTFYHPASAQKKTKIKSLRRNFRTLSSPVIGKIAARGAPSEPCSGQQSCVRRGQHADLHLTFARSSQLRESVTRGLPALIIPPPPYMSRAAKREEPRRRRTKSPSQQSRSTWLTCPGKGEHCRQS